MPGKGMISLVVRPVYPENLQPLWVNFSGVIRLTDNFILDFGYTDLQKALKLREKFPDGNIPQEERQMEAKITSRVAMSVDTFLRLKESIEDVYKSAVEAGIITVERGEGHE
jgi:hypothetical protein